MELFVNFLGHTLKEFFQDAWSIFDLVVVTVSVVSLMPFFNTPGANAVRSIRLIRAFRVMRLFGRLQSIRKIIQAIGHSILPVGNAFIIVVLIMAV